MRVLLLGLPGAGVSTLGALLGQRLAWPFLDEDALVERTGSSTGGLTLLLGMPGQLVGAVPSAVADDPQDRLRLVGAQAHVVWLRCSLPVLARRLGGRLGADTPGLLRRLAASRNEFYATVATQVVDTDALPVGAVAKLIMEAVTVR